MPHCPLEMRASAADNAMGAEFFAKNQDKIKKDLLKYGAIWFRGFDLMKSVAGYRQMHEALGLEPCLDPLHSSGLRKFASERDALYEEVCFRCHDFGNGFLSCLWLTREFCILSCFICALNNRSTSPPCVDITLVCTANLPRNVPLPMPPLFAFKRPRKGAADSLWRTGLPFWRNWIRNCCKNSTIDKFVFP